MAVRSDELINGRTRAEIAPTARGNPSYRIAAIVIWLLGVGATHQLLMGLGIAPRVAWTTPLFWVGVGVAFAVQLLLTVLERPVLIGNPNGISLVVLGVDTLINAGGVFPFAMRIGATPTAQAIATVAEQPSVVSPVVAFAVSVVAGFILAATPEAAWRWKN